MPFPYTFPVVFASTATPFDNAADIINDAAVEIGLPTVEDPFNSNDEASVLLCHLLKKVGRRLYKTRQWSQLVKEHSFTTVAAQQGYPLPSDFGIWIDNTGWNRSTRFPLGTMNATSWQYAKGFIGAVSMRILFRIFQEQIQLFPQGLVDGQTIVLEYVSRFWVQSGSASAPDKDAPTSSSDIIWFDPSLMTQGVRLEYLKAKGFDTAAAQDDYDEAERLATSADSLGPVLSTVPSNFPLIGEQNIPFTGFGSG